MTEQKLKGQTLLFTMIPILLMSMIYMLLMSNSESCWSHTPRLSHAAMLPPRPGSQP